jgi:hypothetical protein
MVPEVVGHPYHCVGAGVAEMAERIPVRLDVPVIRLIIAALSYPVAAA